MIAVLYETVDPAADIHAVLQHIRQSAEGLGADERRMGLLAASGHVVVALSALMHEPALTAAALLHGYTLDFDGSTVVSDAAKKYGFANSCVGKSVADLPTDIPLFVGRAGRDQFEGLNHALDRFVAHALARNLPVTLVNHQMGPHGFDLDDDSETSREVIRCVLAFLQFALSKGP